MVVASHGVTIELLLPDATWLEAVVPLLPPGWRLGDPALVTSRFALGREGELSIDGETVEKHLDDATGLAGLAAELRGAIALATPDEVFVHAGVVARAGQAIVLPGASWSGKSTLVAALVAAGATYYSDEYAVLDRSGRVHPFAKPISIRPPGSFAQEDLPVEQLAGDTGVGPAEIAIVALTTYEPWTSWRPRSGTPGEAALALLAHTVAARTKSAEALRVVRAAAAGALLLEGPRAEAKPTAEALLRSLDERAARRPVPPARTIRAVPSG
jgi:hypothetical protein